MPLFALVLLAASGTARASDVLRCGSHLVNTNALAAQVLGVCGEPAFVDRWEAPASQDSVPMLEDIEEWYYNFGPAQLLRILRFQHGRLTDIQSDGYGFRHAPVREACGPYSIARGISKFRLEQSCGDPVTRRIEYALRPLRGPDIAFVQNQPMAYVYEEQWVYNFGDEALMRVVTLENGRVTDVQSQGRGFDDR